MKRWKIRPTGSNWGDFGDDDQIGRMNLLTPALRRQALSEAREGIVFTLSLPLDYPGGAGLVQYRKPPELFAAKRDGRYFYNFCFDCISSCFTDVVSDDAVTLYTQYSTQWDSLAHVGSLFDKDGDGIPRKTLYNGFSADESIRAADDELGPYAHALGIENLAMAGLQGRGTLVNLHARFGRERVMVGYDDLMRVLDASKSEIRAGDFLCIYTGFADMLLEMKKKPDAALLSRSCAALNGRDERLLQWITDSGIVAICADNPAIEALPGQAGHGHIYASMPLHEHCLFKLGVHLGELWHFHDLADWLATHERSHFLLTAPPLRLPGSVGSPVTPIATV